MDLSTIIAELKSERDKIVWTIAALIGSAGVSGRGAPRKAARKRRDGITPAGRRRLNLAYGNLYEILEVLRRRERAEGTPDEGFEEPWGVHFDKSKK